ncbi:NIPSNAP family protein [Cupriavidus sp. 2TAF22]|uniref:NIPSNAP family protein n=1 Tax=unclassified Cupriavidus TaxID=2640874 RepID=UPI003F90F832
MLYELATLNFNLQDTQAVIRGAEAYVNAACVAGRLLGAWTTDVGALGRMLILREFESAEMLAAERERTLFHPGPFSLSASGESERAVITSFETDSYKALPFLPPITPGTYGSIYEIRTYRLKPGGLPPTITAWEAAVPDRVKLSALVINMYALDGAPRITHIWPYANASERFEIRAEAARAKIWPPKGAPAHLIDANSLLCVPAPFSPLA